MIDLDRALESLGARDPQGEGGRAALLRRLKVEEIAEVLEIGSATVKRDLRAAKAFLVHRLKKG